MSDIVNPLQSLSYTNKDFVSIYTELLDLTKELASTWDPTISNESDPGVILLKLNAIIGDKLSYNSDTNVLELFPLSVTQERNARQLFEQLGYYMHWYKAATTNISITWTGDKDISKEYTIPAFTMVSDFNNTITYTLIGPVDGTTVNTFKVGDQKLKLDGSSLAFKAIQGIPVLYTLNSKSIITVNDLDSNNRLYFPTTDIAENGIFITNVNANNYTDWKKVDNLLVQTVSENSLFYRFGLTQDTSTCYIEFPENAEEIIKNGINITYIKTLGKDGNVSSKIIEKFYSELTPVEDDSVVLGTSNIRMLNYVSAINGEDPQTINNAYKGYKSTVGVFETLVTLRDYIGYILNSGLVSNGFVCDRTNDVQCTYNVMTESNDIDQLVTLIEKDGSNNPSLTAFDLKLYLLQLPVSEMTTASTYSSTFNILSGADLDNVKSYIDDVKCISHDYADLLPITSSRSHFCYFKNRYPISCRIITQYQLTTSAANELVGNIRTALYKALNANEMTFGEEVSSDFIYDIISNSDDRIKTVVLDNIEYHTYAVCYNDTLDTFFEVEISSFDEHPIAIVTNTGAGFTVSVDESTFVNKVGYGNYSAYKFIYDYANSQWTLGGVVTDISEYGIVVSGEPSNNDYIVVGVSIKTQLRDELYTKSVLAGVTQFLVEDEEYDYKLDQTYKKELCDVLGSVERVTTDLVVTMSNESSNSTYNLRNNESIQLYSPNLIDSTTYSTYVKFEYRLNEPLNADEDYQLASNEYFIMYWKESQADNFYKYAVYGQGNILKIKSFDLPADNGENNIGKELVNYVTNIGTAEEPVYFTSSDLDNRMTYTISQGVSTITNSENTLSTTKTIAIRKINQIVLESSDSYCYWVLNEKVIDNNGVEKYRLFEVGETSKILNSGEYFIYTNSTLTNLTILGAGTLITRTASNYAWEVGVKNASDIVENGMNAFNEADWFKIIPSNATITLTEQYYFNINGGSQFKIYLARNRKDYCKLTTSASIGLTVSVDEDTWFEKTSGYGSYQFTYNGTTWKYISGVEEYVVRLSDYGIIIESGTPVSGNIITVTVGYWAIKIDKDSAYRFFDNTYSPISLKDFEISYKDAGSETFTSVTSLNLNSSDYSWMARTLLSVNVSDVEEQILLDNQSISLKLHDALCNLNEYTGTSSVFYHFAANDTNYCFATGDNYNISSILFKLSDEKLYINGIESAFTKGSTAGITIVLDDTVTLTGSNLADDKYETVFMTNYSLNMDGGQTLTTYTLDENLNIKYLGLYVYEKYISSNTQIHINNDGEVDLEFLAGDSGNTIEIPFKLPPGEYILPIYIGSDELENSSHVLNIALSSDGENWVNQHSISDDTMTNFVKKQKYYIYLNLTDEISNIRFNIPLESEDSLSKNVPVILYNLYKYNYSDEMLKYDNPEFQAVKILNLLQIWDSENLFNYTYKVNEDVEISNPLEGKSFLLSNHIYNKFTIPQMMSDIDINIIGKK